MKLRIVRFMLEYHARWGIETAFRELKYGFGLVNLHGKNDDFVKQEIFAAMLRET